MSSELDSLLRDAQGLECQRTISSDVPVDFYGLGAAFQQIAEKVTETPTSTSEADPELLLARLGINTSKNSEKLKVFDELKKKDTQEKTDVRRRVRKRPSAVELSRREIHKDISNIVKTEKHDLVGRVPDVMTLAKRLLPPGSDTEWINKIVGIIKSTAEDVDQKPDDDTWWTSSVLLERLCERDIDEDARRFLQDLIAIRMCLFYPLQHLDDIENGSISPQEAMQRGIAGYYRVRESGESDGVKVSIELKNDCPEPIASDDPRFTWGQVRRGVKMDPRAPDLSREDERYLAYRGDDSQLAMDFWKQSSFETIDDFEDAAVILLEQQRHGAYDCAKEGEQKIAKDIDSWTGAVKALVHIICMDFERGAKSLLQLLRKSHFDESRKNIPGRTKEEKEEMIKYVIELVLLLYLKIQPTMRTKGLGDVGLFLSFALPDSMDLAVVDYLCSMRSHDNPEIQKDGCLMAIDYLKRFDLGKELFKRYPDGKVSSLVRDRLTRIITQRGTDETNLWTCLQEQGPVTVMKISFLFGYYEEAVQAFNEISRALLHVTLKEKVDALGILARIPSKQRNRAKPTQLIMSVLPACEPLSQDERVALLGYIEDVINNERRGGEDAARQVTPVATKSWCELVRMLIDFDNGDLRSARQRLEESMDIPQDLDSVDDAIERFGGKGILCGASVIRSVTERCISLLLKVPGSYSRLQAMWAFLKKLEDNGAVSFGSSLSEDDLKKLAKIRRWTERRQAEAESCESVEQLKQNKR